MDMALWIADGNMGLRKNQGPPVTPGCFALCKTEKRLFAAAGKTGYCLCRKTEEILFEFSIPPGVCTMAAFGPHICALSRDTDSLCAFSPDDGALCLCAPAGIYPRDFSVSPCGRYLAVAGSAAGEVILMDRELRCIRTEKVAGAAIGVCFLPAGLAVLCAMGDENLSSRLIVIHPRGVTEELFSTQKPPLCLCALPDGGCLIGCHGQVLRLNGSGRLSGRLSSPLPVRVRTVKGGILIADSLNGTVKDGQNHLHYQGKEPTDMCFV